MKSFLKLTSFYFATVLFAVSTFAQYQNIRIDGPQSFSPEEVTIAINPANPDVLAEGANIDHFYYSVDGGLSWGKSI